MVNVESFTMDHTKVKAPFVRRCEIFNGEHGDKVTKFDLRFMQPNAEVMPTSAIHTLEHLLAGYMREKLTGVIDISPMGCRTGFYMTTFGVPDIDVVVAALNYSLEKVLETEVIPAANEKQCGNFVDHSLPLAKKYAKDVLAKGISNKIY